MSKRDKVTQGRVFDKPDDFTKENLTNWHITAVSGPAYNPQTENLCFAGWEPFAVDDGILWFRKQW